MTDNNLIAAFMGWEHKSNEYAADSFMVPNTYPLDFPESGETQCTPDAMSFHDRWDWLMPVVEKIKKDKHNPNEMFMGTTVEREIAYTAVTELFICTPIDFVYGRVVKFIKWYNGKRSATSN